METFETHHNLMYEGGQNDHQVTLAEFTEYYTNVSASIDDDMYFSMMMNNSWNLGGDATPYQVYEKSWAAKDPAPVARPQTAGSYQRRDNQRPTGQPTLRSGMPSSDFPFEGPKQFYEKHGSPPRQSLANLKHL